MAFELCVIGGCGHVGVPLSIAFALRGKRVAIFDIDRVASEKLGRGEMPFIEEGGEPAKTTQVMSGQLFKMVKKYFGMIPDQHYLFVWGGKRITPNAYGKESS